LVARIDDGLRDLAEIEKRMLDLAKSAYAGSYEHWTIRDTINHACSWKGNALKKVEARLRGEAASYRSDASLEDVNRHYYEKTKEYSKRKTAEAIDSTLARGLEACGKIAGKESSTELAPAGYEGTVIDYLTFDLIFHPVSHYAYYAIRNDEYEVFLEVERFVSKRRGSIFKDLGVMSVKEFADEKTLREILDKGYEWQHDDLFIQMKSIAG
jgi:hypothetical protein